MAAYDYIHDGTAIYERSFAIIRAEADLSRFSDAEADVAIRMIHACGQVEAASHFVFSSDFVAAAREALAPQFDRGGRASIADPCREVGGARVAQRADHLVAGRQPSAGDAMRDHLRVAEDRRAGGKSLARGGDEVGRKDEMA